MAQKIVDISKYINNDAPQMVLFGKTYTIKNDRETVLQLGALQREQSERNTDEDIIRLLIDGDAQEVINIINNNPNYTENARVVMLNLLSLATGTDYAVLEERFRKAQQ
jgi:hypothetical protein